MAKSAGSARSADNLLQVAGFLKQADKLVRERDYAMALEQIAKARAKDPKNSYAEAYEQRVKLLLSAVNENRQLRTTSDGRDSNVPHSFSQHLESIASLAILEARRNASLSLQLEGLERKQNETKPDKISTVAQTPFDQSEALQSKETQISDSVRSAKEMFRNGHLEEALNTLAPAVLLDPLNGSIVELEHQIHAAQEEQIVARLRQPQEVSSDTKQTREVNDLEIQKCILEATHLAARKEFSKALMVIGQGYLLDPFSVPLAMSEKIVLAALGNETGHSDARFTKQDHEPLDDPSPNSGNGTKVLRHLDNAQALLSEDRFGESLCQVALAMIAVQNKNKSEEIEDDNSSPKESVRKSSADAHRETEPQRKRADYGSRQIFELIGKAKRSAGNGEFEPALGDLFQAFSLIPSDGTLVDVEHEIAKTFMEYYQLMQSVGSRSANRGRAYSPSRSSGESEGQPDVIAARAPIASDPDNRAGTQHLAPQIDRQLEIEVTSSETQGGHASLAKDHLLRCLRHLGKMRFVEASVESEIAALVDSSRKDIELFAVAVSGLAREAKAHVPLSSLDDRFETVRQQGKDLMHTLYYEEILKGLDEALQMLPTNRTLLRRRGEARRAFEEFKRSLVVPGPAGSSSIDLTKRIPLTQRKTIRHSFNQMGLSFSGNPGPDENTDNRRGDETSEANESVPLRKPMHRGSAASPDSTYLGN